MSEWGQAHDAKEVAFQKLARAIIDGVKRKYPWMSDHEAMEYFIALGGNEEGA
jgi:hypothetical protein